MKLNAISIKELWKQNKARFRKRGFNCIIHIIDFERGKVDGDLRYLFLVEGLESWSKNGGHIAEIKFDRDTSKGTLKSRPYNDDCHVFCQCPSFQYWGPAYNSTEGDYNLDHIETRKPDIRDPKREVKICKHISRVALLLSRLSYNGLDKKAGVTASVIQRTIASEDVKLIPVEEALPSLMAFLERSKKVEDVRGFCANLNRSNFESELLRVGAII